MKTLKNIKTAKRMRLKKRIRTQVKGTAQKPRLSVFRSNRNIYAQLIDDQANVTLASVSDIKEEKGTKQEKAALVGKGIAEEATKKKISEVVFDRNGFNYAGRVKVLADSAREAGLKF
jgi:large subunit ribosomal protein L18